MQKYHIETVISEEGVLNIKGLPLHRGEKVEVIVKTKSHDKNKKNPYPLHGKPIFYNAPFDSIAENDWDVIK
jgi:hypothetical protein